MIRDAAGPSPPRPVSQPRREAGPVPDAAGAAPPSPPLLNPRLRIDAALNLVVLEFRDDAGAVSRSIPTAREIDAYRSGADPRPDAPAQPNAGVDVRR
jgi:hypothetical protein